MLKELGDNAGNQNQSLLDQLSHANEVIRQKEAEIDRLNLQLKQLKEDMQRREKQMQDEIT